MIMNKIFLTLIIGISTASCEESSHNAKFTVQGQDHEGKPIVKAKVNAWTFLRWEPGEGFGRDIADRRTEITNNRGQAVFNFPSKRGTFSIQIESPPEYYESRTIFYNFTEVKKGTWQPEHTTITYILKKKNNPIAMYAKNFTDTSRKTMPGHGVNYGYDFEKGDWTSPHGKGVTTDIYFNVKYKEEENGDFDSSIEVSFPNPQDGLIYFEQNQHEGSELTSDHSAPENGYQPSKILRRYMKDGKITSEINRETGNYYLRVRTKLDSEGKIVSANYAKIYGDFMYFTYYFNPTPNDRNIEFDPKKNLFPDEDVTRP